MAGILGQRKRVAGGAGAATRSHPGVQRGRAARGPALSERTPEPMSVMCQCWASLDPRCGKHQLAGERQASPGTGQQMRTSVIGRLMCGSGAYHQSAVRPDSADTRPTGAAMSGLSKRNKGGLWLVAALLGTAMTLTVVTPAAAAARAPAVSASGWAQFQGGAAHTGAEPGENSITAANVSQLSVAWTAPIPAAQTIDTSEVLVIGGSAYVSSVNEVIARDAATGATLWQATLPGAGPGRSVVVATRSPQPPTASMSRLAIRSRHWGSPTGASSGSLRPCPGADFLHPRSPLAWSSSGAAGRTFPRSAQPPGRWPGRIPSAPGVVAVRPCGCPPSTGERSTPGCSTAWPRSASPPEPSSGTTRPRRTR